MATNGETRREGAISVYCGELIGLAKYMVEREGMPLDRNSLTMSLMALASDDSIHGSAPPPWLELSGDEFDGCVARAVTETLLALRNGHNGTSSVDGVSPVYSSQVQTPKRELLVSEARDVAETANAEYLTRRPIIERLGYTESIALIVGGKHAGKTTNVRTLALSVARGLPIWGRATEQGHVTYVCSDDELASTRMELLHMGWKKSDPFVLAHAAPGMYPDPEEMLAAISTAASQQNSVLIILDMLFDFAKIKDEMSYAGTREAIGKIQTLASSTRAFVLATHHSPKYPPDVGTAATAALGSQGIAARFSPIILAKRWADDLYTVESTMTRDPRGSALSATCVKVNDSGWVETLGEFKSWMKWRIYAPRVMGLFEQAEPGKTLIVQAVAAELDIPRPEAQNTLYRLFLDGLLQREQRKRSMHYWLPSAQGLMFNEGGKDEDRF